jgi:hypothetical protein
MEKDFHFAVTYVVGRLAGFEHEPALVIATSAQYVDDTVSEGTIRFDTGEQYRRISSAHEKWNPKIAVSSAERRVWVPFHFLPSADQTPSERSSRFYSSIICRPNSRVAQEMLNHCIQQKDSPFALHRLGVTAHVFVDTWAHQGFAGIDHKVNRASNIKLHNIDPPANRLIHLKRSIQAQGFWSFLGRLWFTFLSKFLSYFFPMGHGAVLHYPDWPFLRWSYMDGNGITVERDNPRDFLEAADELFNFFRRYLDRDIQSPSKGLPVSDRALIQEMLCSIQDPDGEDRCAKWVSAILEGKFSFGSAKIDYFSKGLQSWKYLALGTEKNVDHFWERFEYSSKFLNSDWKHFHDSVQAHQFDMLHKVFPKFQICLN